MKTSLRGTLFLAGLAIGTMALIWTFLWMPAAFQNTDPAIHAQVRYGYIHGAVMALISLACLFGTRLTKAATIIKGRKSNRIGDTQ